MAPSACCAVQFSKSRGTGVFGDDAMSTGIPSEVQRVAVHRRVPARKRRCAQVWRYYLLYNRPELSDTVFTWKDFADKNNNELLKNLGARHRQRSANLNASFLCAGNFVNRSLSFVHKTFNKRVPSLEISADELSAAVAALGQDTVTHVLTCIITFRVRGASCAYLAARLAPMLSLLGCVRCRRMCRSC
jgi:methionyl-tRNA synthetase